MDTAEAKVCEQTECDYQSHQSLSAKHLAKQHAIDYRLGKGVSVPDFPRKLRRKPLPGGWCGDLYVIVPYNEDEGDAQSSI
jgi:hypothetical protein